MFLKTAAVFSVFMLFSGIVFSSLFPTLPSGALSSSTKGAEVGVGVREFIKVAVDKSTLTLADNEGHTTIVPTAEGTPVSGTVNVAVTTNTVKGYDLSLYTQDTTSSMSHENPNVNAAIASVDT
ncbi:hypothetical protein IKG48_01290, partial [Candidatus Saccharibacteria bacterium]|nr:hypothetical protein [Candidatus Saccharibacteria bacterium]